MLWLFFHKFGIVPQTLVMAQMILQAFFHGTFEIGEQLALLMSMIPGAFPWKPWMSGHFNDF